jgi:parallel beta-helix repeat protein
MALILMAALTLILDIKQSKASQTVYIRADGSIEPASALISTADNVTYAFVANIHGSVAIERSNATIDGNGWSLSCQYGWALSLDGPSNVTIKNMTIRLSEWHDLGNIGIVLRSANSKITGTNIIGGDIGILTWRSPSRAGSYIGENNITTTRCGIDLDSDNNVVAENNITGYSSGDSTGVIVTGSNNSIVGNNVANNSYGIRLTGSNHRLTGNNLTFNGLFADRTYGNVVVGNMVNGKPLVYLECVFDQTIKSAGQIVLINCSRMQVENTDSSNATVGVELWGTNETSVCGNNITANYFAGILLQYSSNNTLTSNKLAADGSYGIELMHSSNNNTIARNNITGPSNGIVLCSSSNNNVVAENDVVTGGQGIVVSQSWGNNISRNDVARSLYGILLEAYSGFSSHGNTLSENSITDNYYGIWIRFSPGNNIVRNVMSNNTYNFGVEGGTLDDFINSVNDSNLVNGKPIYYIINQTGISISPATYSNIGYLALINCTDVIVQGLVLSGNQQGILLVGISDSEVRNSSLTRNGIGAQLICSANNTLAGNNIAENTNSAIELRNSSSNRIIANSIIGNNFAMDLLGSSNNSIYHNVFANGHNQIRTQLSSNAWDDGCTSGGNYWSDYAGTDADQDGIGDTSYPIDPNNQDRYPLMAPYIIELPPLFMLALSMAATLFSATLHRRRQHR